MQSRVAHRYVAEIRLDGEQVLATPALAIDWTPAVEWGHFQGVRRGTASLASVPQPALVRPQWEPESGPPYVAAIEICPCSGGSQRLVQIPLRFFAEPVRHAVSSLVEAGRIDEGAAYTWRICAFETGSAVDAAALDDSFTVHEAPDTEGNFETRRLPDLLHHAAHHGPSRSEGGQRDFPVVVSRSVLAEAAATAVAAGDLEAGGILLGRLSRGADSGELIVEVTAQLPASEALADDASLRFTPHTWQAVHAAIGLRHAGERIVGWWHSHPRKLWPCRDCPDERRTRCPSNRAFFSPMDVAFHRTAFQGPVNLALLFSFHEAAEPRHDLFGWWQGLITARDYYVPEEGT